MDEIQYRDNEIQIIDLLLNLFYCCGYKQRKYPSLFASDAPCIKLNQDLNNYDIDDLLGIYKPADESIIIYKQCIQAIAAKLGFDFDELRSVVILHEISHWITHKLPDSVNHEWFQYPGQGSEAELKDVHEGWAQLLTWSIVKIVPRLRCLFEKLNKNQSGPYKVFNSEDFKKYDLVDIIRSLSSMRLAHPCNIESWKSSIIKNLPPEKRGIGLIASLGL